MRKSLMVTAAGAVLALGLGGPMHRAAACDPCYTYQRVTTYQCVTTYETRRVAYQEPITRYDACGRPYTATRTCYRTVQVAVTKKVPVTRLVRVCD